tara:strand:+ start:34719 stop:36857 length:2139 start_codon:yes stop_codon:yes gene_type:complete
MVKLLKNTIKTFVIAVLSVVVFIHNVHSYEASSEWDVGPKAKARLLSSIKSVGNHNVILIGVEVKLKPGWKTYWRSPGESGMPPKLDFSKSSNLKSTNLEWPAPSRFIFEGLKMNGYKDEIVFPVQIEPVNIGEAIDIRVLLDVLACKDICIPHSMKLGLHLPSGKSYETKYAELIRKYKDLVPGKLNSDGLEITSYRQKGSILKAIYSSNFIFDNPEFFIETQDKLKFIRNKVEILNKGKLLVAEWRLEKEREKPDNSTDQLSNVTLTLVDGNRSVESHLKIQDDIIKTNGLLGLSFNYISMIFIAFCGGLILNLMPCVFPVLSIKLLSVINSFGESRKRIRSSFFITSLGIIFSFLILGLCASIAKAAGYTFGWGIQFQQPLFIISIIIILTLFAANLWGFFEINLPARILKFSLAISDSKNASGSFFQGAFATILATPCTAPFVGTSVSFAIAGSISETLTIFVSLGLGMAFPFLLIGLFPGLANKLPKPGYWMIWIKIILGFCLFGTAIWFLTIIKYQVSNEAAYLVGLLMGLIVLLFKINKRLKPFNQKIISLVVLIIICLSFFVPRVLSPFNSIETISRNDVTSHWNKFNYFSINQHVKDGKVVIVDVTAKWCITCQLNKQRVFQSKEVEKLIKNEDVIAMRADWTTPDIKITEYLSTFDRFGVPFNVVYGPGFKTGLILPELLSVSSLFSAIEQTGYKKVKASKE